MAEKRAGVFKRMRASFCHHCPVCSHGRRHPQSWIGRMLHHPAHADHCAFWKAEKELYGDK